AAAAWSTALYYNQSAGTYEGASQDYYTGAAVISRYNPNNDTVTSAWTYSRPSGATWLADAAVSWEGKHWLLWQGTNNDGHAYVTAVQGTSAVSRSEERRVGKEW